MVKLFLYLLALKWAQEHSITLRTDVIIKYSLTSIILYRLDLETGLQSIKHFTLYFTTNGIILTSEQCDLGVIWATWVTDIWYSQQLQTANAVHLLHANNLPADILAET